MAKSAVEDIGRVGDVRISDATIPADAGERMMQDVAPVPVSEAPAIRKRLRHNRRATQGKGKGGKFRAAPGRPARGLLKAGERARGPWDFRKVTGILPLNRDGTIKAVKFRDSLEDEVRRAYAGSNPGLYAWCRGNSATRHEMRALMCEGMLAEHYDELTIEQKLLLMKHLCDASDARDKAMEAIGLDRLSEMPDAIDPMDIAPLPPAELPADVLSPRERSPEEIIGEFEETGEVSRDERTAESQGVSGGDGA